MSGIIFGHVRASSYEPSNRASRLAERIFSSVHMRNFSSLTELIFKHDYCSYWKFQLGYRDEQGVSFMSGLECSYMHGKISSPVIEISVFATELSSPVAGMKLERSRHDHLGNQAEISHMNSNRAEILPRQSA